MQSAFTSPPLPLRPPSLRSPKTATCALRGPQTSRRELLLFLSLSPLLTSHPARADRTGKFSTKLTAKRRYLPRISRGIAALSTLLTSLSASSDRDWAADVASFVENNAGDLHTAMQLFSTMYFSEGNFIGATERSLGETVDELFDAVEGVKVAAGKGEKEKAMDMCEKAVEAAARYVEIAKIKDAVASVPAL